MKVINELNNRNLRRAILIMCWKMWLTHTLALEVRRSIQIEKSPLFFFFVFGFRDIHFLVLFLPFYLFPPYLPCLWEVQGLLLKPLFFGTYTLSLVIFYSPMELNTTCGPMVNKGRRFLQTSQIQTQYPSAY